MKIVVTSFEYHLHCTEQLNQNQLRQMILDLLEVQGELEEFGANTINIKA